MARTVATLLGIGFLLIGVIGFFMPAFLGMHLSITHDIVHLATGAVSLLIGLKGSLSAAKTFCLVFGVIYALLGVGGFVFGSPGEASGVPGGGGPYMWHVIPGALELGMPDHIVHIALGLIYIIGGAMTRTAAQTEAAAPRV